MDEKTSEYAYLAQHHDELVGASAPDGWFVSRWLDDSGAMFVLSRHQAGYYNGSAHFDGNVTATLGEADWIKDTVYVTASVLGTDGATATRLCAAFGQFPYFAELDPEVPQEAVITGLAREVTVYANAEVFDRSSDGDVGPLKQSIEMPDGTVVRRLRYGVGSFLPTGMFGDETTPMAIVFGEVEEAFARTVSDTAATFHVARVTVVGCLPIYVCWPEYLAPVPVLGSIIRVSAFLTAFMPALWERLLADE
ncbi:hypothetical protein A5699_18995 [Mycobacterium sp. E802]|uniref:hypothetical protein n=1 Tax=Mycobacterium sp. E802 TaxID=1834152 RepID=UPI0008000426|nr:hypothetical protein [Mycobacterium sp. E802]OBG87385.1 hypothetical protein A5699_18995 [Mycobacterium sp. E802]